MSQESSGNIIEGKEGQADANLTDDSYIDCSQSSQKSEGELYKCGYCDKVFKKDATRYVHERQKHKTPKPHSFPCEDCGEAFATQRLYCLPSRKIFPMCTQISKIASHVQEFDTHIVCFDHVYITQTQETSTGTEGSSTRITCGLCKPKFVTKTKLAEHCQEYHPHSMKRSAPIPEETRSGIQSDTSESGQLEESKVIAKGIIDEMLDKMFDEGQIQTIRETPKEDFAKVKVLKLKPVSGQKIYRCPIDVCENRFFFEDGMLDHLRKHGIPPEAEAYTMEMALTTDVKFMSEEVETAEISIETEDTDNSEFIFSFQDTDIVDPRADEE